MKIVHLCLSAFYVENMGYQENILPRKHKQQGHNVTIISTQYRFDNVQGVYYVKPGIRNNEDDIPVIILRYKKFLGKVAKFLHLVDGLYNELDRLAPDIIFCHGLSFFSIYELKRYCRKHKTMLFCDCHADYYNTPTSGFKYKIINGLFWPLVVKSIIPYVEKAWGTTPARCEYLKNIYKFPKDKVDLLVMGGDESVIPYEHRDVLRKDFCKRLSISTDEFIICSGGKINKEKKIIELIRAFNSIRTKNIHLLLFGSLTKDIETEFYDLISIDQRISYLGWADQKIINEVLVLSDLAIFPGTHSVLWEQAIACGTPVIYRRRQFMTHVDVGGNCIFIEDGEVDSIREALCKVIFDSTLYNTMKLVTRTKGVETYSYGNIARRSINQYN